MSNPTLSVTFGILRDLLYTAAFLACALVAYLTLQQPPAKQWLANGGALIRVVVFIILTELLVLPFNAIVGDLMAFPLGLISRSNGFSASIQCLGGVLALAGLAVGSWLLAKRSPSSN
jgi:hypothetical protein